MQMEVLALAWWRAGLLHAPIGAVKSPQLLINIDKAIRSEKIRIAADRSTRNMRYVHDVRIHMQLNARGCQISSNLRYMNTDSSQWS